LHSEADVAKHSTLYVVATPIGNLRDITLRALDVLRSVDVVAAEDTRVAGKLLGSYGIAARVIASHQHNERDSAVGIVKLLSEGKSVAMISDAGTPGISDPGAIAVAQAMAAGFEVVAVPGPSALAAALSVCGLSAPRVTFCGFMPPKPAERRALLKSLADNRGLQVFYEAPHRIEETLQDLIVVFGAKRRIAIARELTKHFEEVHQCLLEDTPAWINQRPERIRGEFVVIVEGSSGEVPAAQGEADRVLRLLLDELPLKQAVRLAAEITGQKKNRLYQSALTLRASETAD
jgi:16S rRNA (cytidine1402-2'-O)-methyltransferase